MQLECTEELSLSVPPGTSEAIAEVAARRELDPDEYLRTVVLRELQKTTGYSAFGRAREAQRRPDPIAA